MSAIVWGDVLDNHIKERKQVFMWPWGGLLAAIVIGLISQSQVAFASDSPKRVLTAKQWREQQINDGQNLVIRLGNRIAVLKETTGRLEQIRRLESEQRVAAQNVELLRELTIEDYFNFYLSTHPNIDQAVVSVAKRMPPVEVEALLRAYLARVREGLIPLEPSPALISLAIQQQRWAKPPPANL